MDAKQELIEKLAAEFQLYAAHSPKGMDSYGHAADFLSSPETIALMSRMPEIQAAAIKEVFTPAEVCVLVMGTECKGDEISNELYSNCRLTISQKISPILDSYEKMELDMEIRKAEQTLKTARLREQKKEG